MRNIELKCNLIERIEQLNLSEAEKQVALENILRAKQVAELLAGLTTGVAKLGEIVIVTPVRRAAAWFARLLAPRRPRSS